MGELSEQPLCLGLIFFWLLVFEPFCFPPVPVFKVVKVLDVDVDNDVGEGTRREEKEHRVDQVGSPSATKRCRSLQETEGN